MQTLELLLRLGKRRLGVVCLLDERLALVGADVDLALRLVSLRRPWLQLALLGLDLVLKVLSLVWTRRSIRDDLRKKERELTLQALHNLFKVRLLLDELVFEVVRLLGLGLHNALVLDDCCLRCIERLRVLHLAMSHDSR